ncbi:glutathione-regulated potassium-proton antiporter [Alcanivorax jadensis T9]|jgi:CPA2 family monovalent cation:H+ antiporter-2|uniref:Glutathione-regulated potassium-proton antiporter n=3 Tax=Alcanivorax jadensis TaxID=64988 RepID=A0ABR4WBZ0_9GAMM|nr:monovalent cation:proton antiporter family protein [Alcanivorax jadensis]KGD60546.1 glutathione-regulated potassium-proton antiporter [Alcanivorax jadensis T9]MDF1638215.1 monovalent cation:proton antiporter-2 (CPA2) family protein [Alcanivorax jadensis]|tara:strand:+ start:15244 stop:17196 length:1953 start_codon:yes stop_codon:yes gene_type:complete
MHDALTLIVVLLGTAVAAVVLFRRLGMPPILAYLLCGLAAGPFGFGWVSNTDGIQHLAEFGIVFLLFTLGLEFSIPRLMTLRRIVFGAGPLQVALTGLAVFAIMRLLGFDYTPSLITACALSLSSTAIVIRDLISRGSVNTGYGRTSTGILLFQDLAAVIMLVMLPILTQENSGPMWSVASLTLGKSLLLFAGIYVIGRWVLPRMLEETGRARSDEVFVMTALLLALLAAWVTHWLGLSMALGAFLAGMMLGESHFRHQIEADLRPFRDLLLGLFFISVGMLVDPNLFADQWHWIILAAAALMLFKGLLIFTLLRLLKERSDTAMRSGLILSQAGEFGFVLVALGVSHQLITPDKAGLLVSIVVLTMVFTPALLDNSGRLTRRLLQRWQRIPEDTPISDETRNHVILCGYGRVGQNLMRYLNSFHMKAVAVDRDLVRLQEASAAGEHILFGDSSRKEILVNAGIQHARLLVVTFDDPRLAERILHTARELNPNIRILVRTRDDTYLDALIDAGAEEVVPEVLEASLMLVAHALMMLDVPFDRVMATLRKTRRERYRMLQGYYHGDTLPTTDSAGNPYRLLHAVTLSDKARGIGRSIARCALRDVEIRAVKRDDQTLESPDPELVLEPGDTVILYGPLEAVEAAENRLLGG